MERKPAEVSRQETVKKIDGKTGRVRRPQGAGWSADDA